MRTISIALMALALAAAPEWTVQQSGVMARLRGISASSDRVVWASGSGNTILRSEDGGNTWKKLQSPTTDRLDFRDVDAISDTTAYLLSIGNGTASRIYKTTDAGQTWVLQFAASDQKMFLDAMAFSDELNGVVVGDSIDDAFVILTTSDGGTTWKRVSGLPPALAGEGAFAASGTNVFALGSNVWFGTGAGPRSRVLRSTDRGVTWQIAETLIASGTSSGIYSVAFRDALHGVVVGGDYSKESLATDNVAITSDGGQTWTLIRQNALHGFRSVVKYVPGSKSSFVAIGPLGSDLSTDDGHTWTAIEGPGFDTFSFAPGRQVGWGSGARGAIGRLDLQK
jgi:photosystem II stability/assembly factor-like uncharacterized protein